MSDFLSCNEYARLTIAMDLVYEYGVAADRSILLLRDSTQALTVSALDLDADGGGKEALAVLSAGHAVGLVKVR